MNKKKKMKNRYKDTNYKLQTNKNMNNIFNSHNHNQQNNNNNK